MLALAPESRPFCAIPLRARDGSTRAWTVLDAEDYEWASKNTWRLSTRGYATRSGSFRDPEGKRVYRRLYLHREVLRLRDDPRLTDHISRDKLDNRRANLRPATPAENAQNVTPTKRGYSQHRGVTFNTRSKRWAAFVELNYVHHHLGYFDTEQEAADVASAYRAEHMPYSEDARAA